MDNYYRIIKSYIIMAMITCFLSSCGTPVSPSIPTSDLLSSSPTLEITSITNVIIDGNDDDWEKYPAVGTDSAGDQVPGSPDLAEIKAFNNNRYFYLLIRLNEAGTTDHYDVLMDINGSDFDYQVSVWPDKNQAVFAPFPVTSGMTPLDGVSAAQQGITIEVKIPLAVIENQPVLVVFVQTFLGDKVGDQIQDIRPTSIQEEEPVAGGMTGIATQPTQNQTVGLPSPTPAPITRNYTSLWGLSNNLVGDALLISPVGNNGGLTRSQGGTIYLKTWGSEAGVSLLDVDTASVTRLFYVPPTAGLSDIIGGPEDTAFMNVVAEVWQIHPDGSHTVWGVFPDAFIVAYTPDGRMLGKTHNGNTLLELHPDGSMETIASGFNGIYDVAVMPDGVIVVYEWNTGDIVRLDPDGTKRILVPHVMPGDFANLGLDFSGQLYMNSAGSYGFKRLDVNTGTLTDIPTAYSSCIWNPNDFVFIEPGKILLTGDQLSWADINSGKNGLLIQNIASTFAASIGSDNGLYIGASGCEKQIPARILRISNDGSQSVYIDNLDGVIQQMAFSPGGDLFLVTSYNDANHLLFIPKGENIPVEIPDVPPGSIMALAVDPHTGNLWLSRQRGEPILEFDQTGLVRSHPVILPGDAHQFIIEFSPDGTLYAYVGRTDGPTGGPWLVSINPSDGKSTVIAELPRRPAGGGMGAFTVDSQGNLWVILNPESILYQIKPDGTVTQFAQNLPIDAPAIAVNPAGDIYFTCSSGIFRIFNEP